MARICRNTADELASQHCRCHLRSNSVLRAPIAKRIRSWLLCAAFAGAVCPLVSANDGEADADVEEAKPLPEIIALNSSSFERTLFPQRGWSATARAVLFHRASAAELLLLQAELQQCAAKLEGLAIVYSLDCESFPSTCASQNVMTRRLGAGIEAATLLVYPPPPGAAEIYSGALKAADIASGVMRRLASRGLALQLTQKNAAAFMQSTLRPFKLIMFTPGGGVPAIVHVLAGDPDLQFAVAYAYCDAKDKALVSNFGVEDTPALLIQYGEVSSTRRFYTTEDEVNPEFGDATLGAWHPQRLRKWIMSVIAAKDQGGLDEKFPPLEVPALVTPKPKRVGNIEVVVQDPTFEMEMAVTVPADGTFFDVKGALAQRLQNTDFAAKTELAWYNGDNYVSYGDRQEIGDVRSVFILGASFPQYEKMHYGEDGCVSGFEITSAEECERAITLLGFTATPKWVSVYDGLPRFCSIRENADKRNKERMHFNSAGKGTGRPDLAPICKGRSGKPRLHRKAQQKARPASRPAAKPATTTATKFASAQAVTQAVQKQAEVDARLPELMGASHKELFGNDGLSFVYLREGPITSSEVDLILALQSRFSAALNEKGTRVRWMWMDARLERRVKMIFDPEIMPSAVIINPHKRPRFASLKHGNEDDDPEPATEEMLVHFINKLIGDDLRFKTIGTNKLFTLWTDREKRAAVERQSVQESSGKKSKTSLGKQVEEALEKHIEKALKAVIAEAAGEATATRSVSATASDTSDSRADVEQAPAPAERWTDATAEAVIAEVAGEAAATRSASAFASETSDARADVEQAAPPAEHLIDATAEDGADNSAQATQAALGAIAYVATESIHVIAVQEAAANGGVARQAELANSEEIASSPGPAPERSGVEVEEAEASTSVKEASVELVQIGMQHNPAQAGHREQVQ